MLRLLQKARSATLNNSLMGKNTPFTSTTPLAYSSMFNNLSFNFSRGDRRQARKLRMQEQEKILREEERRRIMNELNKNRASFQAGEKVSKIGFRKLAQYDLLLGGLLILFLAFFNIEVVESPSTDKNELIFNSEAVSMRDLIIV